MRVERADAEVRHDGDGRGDERAVICLAGECRLKVARHARDIRSGGAGTVVDCVYLTREVAAVRAAVSKHIPPHSLTSSGSPGMLEFPPVKSTSDHHGATTLRPLYMPVSGKGSAMKTVRGTSNVT